MNNIRVPVTIIIILWGCQLQSYGQNDPSDRKLTSINKGIVAGANYSWFKNSVGNYSLNSPELYFGGLINKHFSDHFSIQMQAIAGIKTKSPYDYRLDIIGKNVSGEYTDDVQYVITEVDIFDKTLSQSHYYIEVPLQLGIKLINRIYLYSGVATRYYFRINDSYDKDFLVGKFEFTIMSGFKIGLTSNLNIETGFGLGINDIYSNYVLINTGAELIEYSSILKSRSIQIKLIYEF